MKDEMSNKIIELAVDKFKKGEIKTSGDVESYIDSLIGPLYQKILEMELENMLEYPKYKHKEEKNKNYRNGYCKSKKIQTSHGIIEVKTPRDRNGEFEPVIIPKGENKLGKFESITLALCAKGMSYRDTSALLKEIYGVDISKDQISKFVNGISEVVDNWLKRPLKPFYTFIYADCLYIPVMEDLKSEKKAFYVIIGVDVNGMKEILGIWCDATESASFWTIVFEDLKERGIEDILYSTSDGIAGFQGSLETTFPKTKNQRCVVHLARNLYKICPRKEASNVMQNFKKIYSATNLDVARLELENFKQKFGHLPKVVDKVQSNMVYLEQLFEVPEEIRKAIYTSNAIESVNSALRKVTNGKGAFTTPESVYKLLYLRIEELHQKWKKPIPNWSKIQLQLIEIYGERYTKYLNI